MPRVLSVATWNVHGFVGADGRRDPERVARVLRAVDADVIALQEVDGRDEAVDAFETLGPSLGFEAVPGPTLLGAHGSYGNLLLTRRPLEEVASIDLSVPGSEPRGAIDARLSLGPVRVRVIATHLGLGLRERARQARRLCELLDAPGDEALVVMLGDLNEWRRPLRSTGLSPLIRRFASRSRHRTFPARAPLLSLDRVLVDRADAPVRIACVERAAAREASDHLPLRAEIDLGGVDAGAAGASLEADTDA